MFGYVNILKEELKVKDYLNFRAYYCGLCHASGKRCSQMSRLGLSYDMTFLAILLSALSKDVSEYRESPCIAHPLHKRKYIINDSCVDYAADASAILYYSKLKDDLHDDRSLRAFIGCAAFPRAYKKASKRNPALAEHIKTHLNELSVLEKNNSSDIDLCANCFALITEKLFSPDFTGENKRPAAWLGYNIGRWIYIIDAIDDFAKDEKKGSYNPFLNKKAIEESLPSLWYNLSETAKAYELLDIKRNKGLTDNIIYYGLKAATHRVLKNAEIIIINQNGEF